MSGHEPTNSPAMTDGEARSGPWAVRPDRPAPSVEALREVAVGGSSRAAPTSAPRAARLQLEESDDQQHGEDTMAEELHQDAEDSGERRVEWRVDEPLLVEDVLLLLFQPSSGAVAGEGTLSSVLGGAVVADLALRDLVEVRRTARRTSRVASLGDAPRDDILRSGWDYVAAKPRDVQTVIAAIGPALRSSVLDRLVEHEHLERTRRRVLGLIPWESLELRSGRRAELLERVRATLVDGREPDVRTAAIAALLSASGNLHQFHPEVPWSSPVIQRAKELEDGNWGATAAAEAVTRTMATVITGAMAAASAATAAGRG